MQTTDSRFDKNGQLLATQWVFVYGYDYMNVFTNGYSAYLTQGMSLPPGTTLIQPPARQNGYAAVYVPEKDDWYVTPDHRGETVYNKQTQQATTIDYLGTYRDGVTPIKPGSAYDNWDDMQGLWVTDSVRSTQEEKIANISLMTSERARAEEMVGICNDKIELEYYNPGETEESVSAQLKLWRRYYLDCINYLNGVLTTIPDAPDSAAYKQKQEELAAQAVARAQADRQAEIEKQQEAEKAEASANAQSEAEDETDENAGTDTDTQAKK